MVNQLRIYITGFLAIYAGTHAIADHVTTATTTQSPQRSQAPTNIGTALETKEKQDQKLQGFQSKGGGINPSAVFQDISQSNYQTAEELMATLPTDISDADKEKITKLFESAKKSPLDLLKSKDPEKMSDEDKAFLKYHKKEAEDSAEFKAILAAHKPQNAELSEASKNELMKRYLDAKFNTNSTEQHVAAIKLFSSLSLEKQNELSKAIKSISTEQGSNALAPLQRASEVSQFNQLSSEAKRQALIAKEAKGEKLDADFIKDANRYFDNQKLQSAEARARDALTAAKDADGLVEKVSKVSDLVAPTAKLLAPFSSTAAVIASGTETAKDFAEQNRHKQLNDALVAQFPKEKGFATVKTAQDIAKQKFESMPKPSPTAANDGGIKKPSWQDEFSIIGVEGNYHVIPKKEATALLENAVESNNGSYTSTKTKAGETIAFLQPKMQMQLKTSDSTVHDLYNLNEELNLDKNAQSIVNGDRWRSAPSTEGKTAVYDHNTSLVYTGSGLSDSGHTYIDKIERPKVVTVTTTEGGVTTTTETRSVEVYNIQQENRSDLKPGQYTVAEAVSSSGQKIYIPTTNVNGKMMYTSPQAAQAENFVASEEIKKEVAKESKSSNPYYKVFNPPQLIKPQLAATESTAPFNTAPSTSIPRLDFEDDGKSVVDSSQINKFVATAMSGGKVSINGMEVKMSYPGQVQRDPETEKLTSDRIFSFEVLSGPNKGKLLNYRIPAQQKQ